MTHDTNDFADGYDDLRRELIRRQFDDRNEDISAGMDCRLEKHTKGKINVAEEYLSRRLDGHVAKAIGRCCDDPEMLRQGEEANNALRFAKDAIDGMSRLMGQPAHADEIFEEAVEAALSSTDASQARRRIRKLVLDIGYPKRR